MDWKNIGRRLLFLPGWLLIILSVFSTGLLVAVFLWGQESSTAAYMIYVLAFYTLCAVTVFCIQTLPKRFKTIKKKISDSPLGRRYTTDSGFRTRISFTVSLTVNLFYVLINLWSWYMLRSWWFAVLAGYYMIMALLRFLLSSYIRKTPLGSQLSQEWKRARLCAYILLLINLSLSGAVLMILYQNKGYHYPGMMIYVMAMYTFYTTIHAILEIVRNRKRGSPVLSAAKSIALSAALVSVLNLETAMFDQFGADMAPESQRLFIILTGAGVSVAVVTLSILLIITATKELRRERNGA